MPGSDKKDEAFAADHKSKLDLASLTAAELLRYLRNLGVELSVNDGKILLNAPVGAITAELQSELRRRKPELIAQLKTADDEAEERSAPLTYAQQRLWLIDRFTPDTIAYNIPQSWILEGPLDIDALRQAAHRLVERHSALRTRIDVRNGEAIQVVMKSVEVPFDFIDLTVHPSSEINESKILEILVREGRKPFALDHAPLIRFHVFKVSDHRHVVSYNVHHIVADQWSLNTMQHDLAALYLETISGHIAELPALTLHYADVAIRERSDAAARLHAGQISYWRERLKGMPVLLELPFGKGHPAELSYVGETLSVTLKPDLTKQLRHLAANRNTSLYLVMLSAFAVLLYRYTGQKDLCIGTPISGRKLREEEDLVGLFVNMLPLRCEVEGRQSFDDLLQQIGSAVLKDFDHSDVPFQKLVTELHPQRSQVHSPLFQIMFALNPKGAGDDRQLETFNGTAKFDLTLQVAEQQDTLDAHFEFRTDLFSRTDIERFSRHFIQLAESLVTSPRQEIGSAALLTEEDNGLLQQWNATDLSFDRAATLISLFEDQVRLHEDEIALRHRGKSHTFRELHSRVVCAANALHAAGVERGNYVGICLERTPELMISILAVLKVGAAYVPLDPKYPEERLAYMLRDSGACVMITERNPTSERLTTSHPALMVVFASEMAEGWESETGNAKTMALDSASPEDAAYLIYTSGSTGKPKGVIVEHRNAVELLKWAKNYFAPESLRGMLASTSLCFDLSIFEIFLPLSTGNTIVLMNDVLELPRSEDSARVTLINTVPSAMNALLHVGLPPSVTTVCMAGELLSQELVEQVYAAGAKQVFDLYGPTETTTYSTCALRLPNASSSIGRPISNTRIYLLDECLTQVPPGAVGEIVIGGEGVTRGYLNQPELTDERFIQLASIEPRSRLYRSGDLARQLDDGSLVYLGRRDQQIKLRGHRIELGEIETVLREESGASQVAVVLQKPESGDVLVGFVAKSGWKEGDVQALKTALRRRLPAHMIPARIIALTSLPLTPNGKIDRKTLGVSVNTSVSIVSESPRDLLEQWVANIWALKLGKKQIARNAHFFEDLGGHSLVAFEIFAEIEKRLGASMLLATLFQAPTIELLAAVIRLKKWMSPRQLRFIASGATERVIYLVSDSPRLKLEGLRTSEERVMAIGSTKSSKEVDDWTQEIAAFEASRPSLLLVAEVSELEVMRRLAANLGRLGFSEISQCVLEQEREIILP